jgi:hypothetical protein
MLRLWSGVSPRVKSHMKRLWKAWEAKFMPLEYKLGNIKVFTPLGKTQFGRLLLGFMLRWTLWSQGSVLIFCLRSCP